MLIILHLLKKYLHNFLIMKFKINSRDKKRLSVQASPIAYTGAATGVSAACRGPT